MSSIQDGERRTLSVQYEFTDTELQSLGKTLAEKHADRDQVLANKKAAMDAYKTKVSEVEGEIAELARKRREGYEMRPTECRAQRSPEKKVIEWINVETGEIVRDDPFTDNDYQLELHDSLKVNESPLALGITAYENDAPTSANPFHPEFQTEEHDEWLEGYNEAMTADEPETAEPGMSLVVPGAPDEEQMAADDAASLEPTQEEIEAEDEAEAGELVIESDEEPEADEAFVEGEGTVGPEAAIAPVGIDASLPDASAALPEGYIEGAPETLIYNEGRKAFKDQLDWDDCPHAKGTTDAVHWQNGWTDEMST